MNPIEVLFNWLRQFGNFPPDRYDELRKKALDWWANYKNGNGKVASFVKKWSEDWRVMVGMVIVFIVGVRFISDWMMNRDVDLNDPLSKTELETQEQQEVEAKKKFSFFN